MRRHDAARIPQDLLSPDVEAAYVASRRVASAVTISPVCSFLQQSARCCPRPATSLPRLTCSLLASSVRLTCEQGRQEREREGGEKEKGGGIMSIK